MESRHFLLVSCEVFYREMCAAIAASPHRIDLSFLPQGLHDLPNADMTSRVQAHLDGLETSGVEAILLGYGLCNNGLAGLIAREVPLVMPRAHDCITLFLGSKKRYLDYFNANPGVYFLTTGWIERDHTDGDLQNLSVQHQIGMDRSFQQLVDKYGEDNAKFLYEQLCHNAEHNYAKYAFIAMGIEPDDRFEQHTRDEAANRGWGFEKLRGDMSLIHRLAGGDWDEEDFLIVPPGHKIAPSYDHGTIVRAVPVE